MPRLVRCGPDPFVHDSQIVLDSRPPHPGKFTRGGRNGGFFRTCLRANPELVKAYVARKRQIVSPVA